MNLFEIAKASVSVPKAARAYGLDVTRHNMVRCPFHDDRHSSLKLNPDFYYCSGAEPEEMGSTWLQGCSTGTLELLEAMYDELPAPKKKKK